VRWLASEHLVCDSRKRIEIAACIDLALTSGLLGAHVLRSAKRQSGLREPPTAGARHSESDAEVGYERMTIVKKNVLRLDVTMYHTMTVRISESASNFARDAQRIVYWELPLTVETRAKRFALDERHHIEELSFGLP
jgi:hypothetical protein